MSDITKSIDELFEDAFPLPKPDTEPVEESVEEPVTSKKS